MTGPKRLWSGDWMAESAALRARMAERRGLHAGDDDEAADEPAQAPVPTPARRRVAVPAAGPRSLRALARRFAAAGRLAPRGLRARLIVIAVLAGLAGAGAMVGIEEASGGGAAAATPASTAYLGVELGPSLLGQGGALVEYVAPGSPAEAAGVLPGDVITSIAGRPVTSPNAAASAIRAQRPGSSLVLGLDRLGSPATLTVTLGSRGAGSP